MGEAGANMAHWAAGLYGGTGAGGNGGATEGSGSGVTVSSPTSGGSGGSPARSAPGVEGGRVGKPARRRSRASRRAPVTLLNTDTSNFRAMVQQFTGIPSGPYGPGGPVISFGAGGSGGVGMPVRPSPTSAVMSFDHLGGQFQLHRPAVASSLQQQQQQQQQQQSQLFRPQQHQHQQQQYGEYGGMLSGGVGGGDMFLHGFESSAEDRLLLQSIQAAGTQMMPRPASTNNTNGYNFG